MDPIKLFAKATSGSWDGNGILKYTPNSFLFRRNELVNEFLLCIFIVIALILMIGNFYKIKGRKTRNKYFDVPLLPLIGTLRSVVLNSKDLLNLLLKWQNQLGPCWRVKFFTKHFVAIHDPALLKPLLESGLIGHLEKSPVYNMAFIGAINDGLLTMPAKNWAPHRKAMNSLFTYEAFKNYIGIFKKHADELVYELTCQCESFSNRPSYSELIHVQALNIIAEIAIGVPLEDKLGRLGCLQFHKDVVTYKDIITNRFYGQPWQSLPFIWYFHPERKRLHECTADIESAVHKVRESHVPTPESKFALDMMINSNWSNAEITSEILTLFVGGHETVSNILSIHLWMLALEQEHQLKCQQEVDKLFDALETSGEELTLMRLSDLKYLKRCIKESLRIFPVFPFGTARDLTCPINLGNNMTLKSDTTVMFFPYVLHRNPEVFPDPEKFDPDRFLPENVRKRSIYSYLPFSAGPRNCIGWKMGLLELTVLSAVILRHFNLQTTDRREDIKILFRFTLSTSKTPDIIFQKRR